MSLTIEKLLSILGPEQVEYLKIQACDYITDPTARPESQTSRIAIPQYFRDVFSTGFNVQAHAPAGTELTLWHCLLYILVYERYTLACWEQRKKYVETLIQELDERVQVRYSKSSTVMRNTHYAPLDLKYRAKFITDSVLFAVCECLNINILIVSPASWQFHHGGPVIDSSLPLIILNKDYQQCYSVVIINDVKLFNSDHIVSCMLMPKAPPHNMFLASILRNCSTKGEKDLEFLRLVRGQSVEESKKQEHSENLSKLKVAELKALCEEANIDISTLGRLTKAKMIEALQKKAL